MQIVECVPNFSEGRRKEVVDKIVEAIVSVNGIKLLDREMDENHNRCVISFIGEPGAAKKAAFNGIKKASELIDLRSHKGEHPRFGAADVVPFIPISEMKMEECVELARSLGEYVAKELNIPIYLYGTAARLESRKNLEEIRSKSFQYEQLSENIGDERWKPDYGPSTVGSAGATIIGARDPLIAYNVNLRSNDISIGKKIAKALRAKDGGLTFVKALAFYLEDKGMVQISMNLTSYEKTPIYRAYELVKLEANRYGISIAESEVVGLVPIHAITESLRYYLQLNNFSDGQLLEKKMME